MSRSGERKPAIAVVALAVAFLLCAGPPAVASSGASGTLQLRGSFSAAYVFGPFCPPATPVGTECVRFVGTGDVPGLGRATSTYVKTLFEPGACPLVTQFRRAEIEVAGKGTIELSLPGIVCGPTAPAEVGPLEIAISGGTGIYTGAFGGLQFRSSVYEPGSRRCGGNPCGFASDTWTGTLTVPGLEFDLTPPAIRGAVAKTVRAPKRAKRVRVRYAVSAQDAVDGALPVACKPRSGSSFKAGRTIVSCSATDSSANTSRSRFAVTVTRARG